MHHPSSNRQPTNEAEKPSTREHLHSHALSHAGLC
jgi:hypothetical protein